MSEGRVTLELDKYECGVIFHSLKDKRNQIKVIEKMEVPPEKPRKGYRRHEER